MNSTNNVFLDIVGRLFVIVIFIGIPTTILFFVNIGLKRFIKIKIIRWFINVLILLFLVVFLMASASIYVRNKVLQSLKGQVK